MENWYEYESIDFGIIETDSDGEKEMHIDGYVYYADGPEETPYRHVQFCWCYIPLDKLDDEEYISLIEEECKQYIGDITEEEAKEIIEWYLNNGYQPIGGK